VDVGAQQENHSSERKLLSTSVGFAGAKVEKPARRAESECLNEDTGFATLPLSWAGRHAALGGAGCDCGQFRQMGCYLAPTEHLSQRGPQGSRTR